MGQFKETGIIQTYIVTTASGMQNPHSREIHFSDVDSSAYCWLSRGVSLANPSLDSCACISMIKYINLCIMAEICKGNGMLL